MRAMMIKYVTSLSVLLIVPLNAYALSFPNIDTMLDNINTQIPYLWALLTAFAYIAGFWLIFHGILQLKQYGDPHSMMSSQKSFVGPITSLIVGAMLVYSPTVLLTGVATIFGTDSTMAYPTDAPVDSSFTLMGQTLVTIVQFVGAVAFIRGLVHFHRLGSGQAQQGTFSKGLTHVIGGTLALNIVGTADVIGSTLGIVW